MRAVILIIFVAQLIHKTSFTATTLSQKQRIKILRQKIDEEIFTMRNNTELYPAGQHDSLEGYEYDIQNEKTLITPIIEVNDLKINENFKKRAKTTTVKTMNNTAQIDPGKGNSSFSQLRSKKRLRKSKKVKIKKPIEIFYRRIYNKQMLQERLEWVHCQDMITPILTGVKVNISNPKRLFSTDRTVVRFLQLLNINTTLYGRDEVYSILYQISNLKLRLFQWDIGPLNMLFNVIIKDKKHTFGNLKRGIRDLFHKWRLDISNTSSLLRQARIFRPPCVQVSTLDGSTKSPKITKYTKAQSETTTCEDYDDCRD